MASPALIAMTGRTSHPDRSAQRERKGKTLSDDDLMHRQSTGMSIDALNVVVAQQGLQLRDLAQDTSKALSSLRADVTGQFTEIKTLFVALQTRLDVSTKETSERGRINWLALLAVLGGSVATAITIGQGLTALEKAPLEDKIASLQQVAVNLDGRISNITPLIDTKTERFMTTQEADTRKAGYERRFDTLEKDVKDLEKNTMTEDQIAKAIAIEGDKAAVRSEDNRQQHLQLRERVVQLESTNFSRHEHEVYDATVQRQVDEINRRVESLYPAGTLLKDMNDRLHALEIENVKK